MLERRSKSTTALSSLVSSATAATPARDRYEQDLRPAKVVRTPTKVDIFFLDSEDKPQRAPLFADPLADEAATNPPVSLADQDGSFR